MDSVRATATTEDRATYSVAEIARRLGININLAYAACNAGQVAGAFKVGGRWLIARQAFDRFLETGKGA